MTKNEMQRECEQCVEDCLHARFDVGVGNIDAEEWNEKVAAKNTAFDAYALADTLGMLEAIVHKGRYIEYMDGKQALLVWRTPTGRLTYQIDLVHVTRAEVEALLGEGKEEKE